MNAHLLQPPRRANRGFFTLLTVIAAGTVGTAVAVAALLSSARFVDTALALNDGYSAKAFADTCAEHALRELHQNANFTGSDTVSIDGEECAYDVQRDGDQRTIQTSAEAGEATRRVEIIVSNVRPRIEIESWEEVVSFEQ